MKRKTICHVITALSYGGAENMLVNLTKLQAEDCNLYIFYFKKIEALKPLFSEKVTLIHIGTGIKSIFLLRKYLTRLKPDVIHTHLGHADFIGLSASIGLSTKRIITMHNVWFKFDYRDKLIFKLYHIFLTYLFKNVQIVAISETVKQHCISTLGLNPTNVHLLHNAIPDLDKNQVHTVSKSRELAGLPQEKFIILFVGRLEKQKAVHLLLQAIAKLSFNNILAVILGEGSLKASLLNVSNELGIGDKVEFREPVKNPELFFQAADMLLLPSLFEGFGIVIIEAFRSQLPVAASNLEGPKELIRNGENGLLFSPGNVDEIVECISTLYESKDLRKKIGYEGYKSFDSKFNMDLYFKKINSDVYKLKN